MHVIDSRNKISKQVFCRGKFSYAPAWNTKKEREEKTLNESPFANNVLNL
jgi:hypothetical protein